MKAARTRALHKKHAGTHKHGHLAGAKHTPTAHKKAAVHHKQVARRTAKQVKAAKARALSVGDVSCCSADALAWSLRLTGWPVAPADVLDLYRLTADSPDAGASILATLDAAYVFGLAGVRPVSFERLGQWGQRVIDAGDLAACGAERLGIRAALDRDHADVPHSAALAPAEDHQPGVKVGRFGDLLGAHGLILGLELPEGPHAVTLDPSGDVWSWGSLYTLGAEAVIEEAWAVTWP